MKVNILVILIYIDIWFYIIGFIINQLESILKYEIILKYEMS